MTPWTDMADVVPPGECGKAKIVHTTVTAHDAAKTAWRVAVTGDSECYVPAGTYCQLYVDGQLMMSDTKAERRSNLEVLHRAQGEVLIAGLGIGMLLLPLLAKPEVTQVTVLEKYREVIQLVEPHIRRIAGETDSKKLVIVEADVFRWRPDQGVRYDVLYFDIWPTICVSNLDEMTRLHRRFCRRKKPGGWMSSWKLHELRNKRRWGSTGKKLVQI